MARRSLARRWTYDVSRLAARLTAVVFFRIRCTGRDLVPADGGVLICANHQSFLDPVLVGLACDRRLNCLARDSLFRWPPLRWLIRWYDAIPIQQEGIGIGGLKETLRRLKRGEMVLIFPEGTRTWDGSVAPPQPGICALARRGKVPLVPVGIDGAFEAWPRSKRFPRCAVIHIHIGDPIPTTQVQKLTDDELLEQIGGCITACHLAAQRGRTGFRER